jgi:hypothetical protein
MRLFELAYCCRLYAEGTGYDVALARFLEGTNGAVDLNDAAHRALTLQWLRDWGCRSLRREDDERSSEALREWWRKWSDALPAPHVTLDSLGDDGLDTPSQAYGDLALRIGPRRQLSDRLIDVRFGPTTAGKAMYKTLPSCGPGRGGRALLLSRTRRRPIDTDRTVASNAICESVRRVARSRLVHFARTP